MLTGPTRRNVLKAGLVAALGMLTTGCGPEISTENMSPAAEDDPDRTARAVEAAKEQMRKNQEAERKAMSRRKGVNLPE